MLIVVLFGAFAFRLWRLGVQSLWHDEAWAVFSAYHPLAWGELGTDPNAPPIFYMTLGLWQNLVGDSVWAMRCWSALLGTITVALTGLIARRWFGNLAAVVTGLLVAASPILWVFSQEIRAFVAMSLLALILLMLADALLRPRDRIPRRIWLWILLIEIVTLYVHNLSVPLIAWLNVTVIAASLLRREWRRLIVWLIAQVGLLILYLPWLLTQTPTGTPLNTPPAVNPALVWNIWQSYFTGIKALLDADSLSVGLVTAFGIVALIAAIIAVVRVRNQQVMLVLSQAILLPTFETLIILSAHIDFHPRYYVLGVPATLILIAVGLTSVPAIYRRSESARFGHLARRFIAGTGILAVCVLALLITARMASVLYSSAGYQHDDFRAIAEHYAQLGPDDAIIVPYGWEPTLDYYSRMMNFKAHFINIPLHADAATIITRMRSELEGVQRAEFLTWYQLPADLRGAYPCLLGTNRLLEQSLTFSGVKTDAYVASGADTSMPAADIFNKPADFDTLKLVGMQSWSGSFGQCVITRWQLAQQTSQNWSIAVRAQNPLGWEIARTDSPLLNDNQVPTSLWKVGEVETAFSTLTLPEGTVFQAAYPVVVTAYSPQSPHGLDVLQDGKVLGKDATIGTVTHYPGTAVTLRPQPGDDTDMGDGLYLHTRSRPYGPFEPGGEVRVTLGWWRLKWPDDAQIVIVMLTGDNGWQVSSFGTLYPAPQVLTWHSLVVPATASGHAILSVTAPSGQSLRLGEYYVATVNHVFIAPPLAESVSADFAGVGTLVGVREPADHPLVEPLRITLIWKAAPTSPQIAYTVFIHLLDQNGQVVAQDDAQPVGGTRPTTGWVAGEYIVDDHDLHFNRSGYSGPATLEIGLYDPATGKRVSLSDGSDHFIAPYR